MNKQKLTKERLEKDMSNLKHLTFNIQKQKAITLISLVITIVILIILAGVTISMTIGENGIFSRAKLAKEQYLNAEAAEQEKINGLSSQLSNGDFSGGNEPSLPENTTTTPAGTEVKLPESWLTQTVRYVKTDDGSEVKDVTEVATVYAVAVGEGNSVPVPYGFYYVGGNLNTGVVISDNSDDKNKYADDEDGDIPNDPVGNQFVWIPCTASNYHKYDTFNGVTQYYTSDTDYKFANSNWDKSTNTAEVTQIQKYGGFYVGRYESGLASTISEYTSAQAYNSSVYDVSGTPQIKAGILPWNFISWTKSQENAENMYNTNFVNSGLITGTQWDVMITKIASATSKSLVSSGAWGNYHDNSISYTGRMATYNTSNSTLGVFGSKTTGNTTTNGYNLLTTGSSETAKAYNLYDVAGNLWEWTEEASYYGGRTSSTQYQMLRGGCYGDLTPYGPACYRNGHDYVNYPGFVHGFRVVLYMK